MNDCHDIRPRLIYLAMDIDFLELVIARAAHSVAVEIILDNVRCGHAAGRNRT